MQKWNGRLDRLVDRVGWGIFIILIGLLFLAQNQGWIKADGWSYFAIGLGGILTVGGMVPFLAGQGNRWRESGRLICGLALLYIGIAFLYGFGDWWPLALIPIGIGYTVKAFLGQNKSTCDNTRMSF
jgi:hypothetical protein